MNIANIYGKNAYLSPSMSGGTKGNGKEAAKEPVKSISMTGTMAKCFKPSTLGSRQVNDLNGKQSAMQGNNVSRGDNSVRENLRALARNGQDSNSSRQVMGNSVINDIRNYSGSLRARRLGAQSSSNNMKKLKYHFKSIASKILRSKTSASARQVVGQAKREIIKLKREKQSGKYSNEEIDAAITHAKAMERIARKKVKHLEEEEMAKATGGPCADRPIDEEEIRDREKEAYDKLNEADEEKKEENSLDSLIGDELNSDVLASYYSELYSDTEYEILDPEMYDMYMDMSDSLESMDVILSDMQELTSEMMDEFSQSMQDMLEEMGLGEISDGAVAAKGDMDPADLKAMKIKHRNKEMKEIVKADAEYLKAVFDQLEKARSGGSTPVNAGSSVRQVGPAAAIPEVSVSVNPDVHSAPMASIDISL